MKREEYSNPHIMREITPLSAEDCFYVADRKKACFDYPIHCHPEYELNFIENAAGATRVVGDSMEPIGDYELVLIASPDLEHGWEQGTCTNNDIREITVQWDSALLPDVLLEKNQFRHIHKMLEHGSRGLCFPQQTIMRVYSKLEALANSRDGFQAVLDFLSILNDLSLFGEARELSSSSFSHTLPTSESFRVQQVQQYIARHFHEEIRLETLADMVGMTPVAFSRYFRQRTGRTLSDYIVDVRIGMAARKLVDSIDTVQGICYDCGFNTLSNFNRLFRRKKNCSPKEFRETYLKKKIII